MILASNNGTNQQKQVTSHKNVLKFKVHTLMAAVKVHAEIHLEKYMLANKRHKKVFWHLGAFITI